MQQKIVNYTTLVLLLFCFNSMYGQVTHKVSFSDDYSINQVELIDGNLYNEIKFSDLQFTCNIGYPSLPVKYIKLLIPANSKATGIIVNQVQEQAIKLDYWVEPVQYPEKTGFNNPREGFVGPDKNKYNSENPYPPSRVEIVEQGLFRGNRVVTIAVYPFQYYPIKNELEVTSSVDFTLMYNSNGESKMKNQVKIDESSFTGKVLRSLVENTGDIKTYGIQYQKEDLTQSKSVKTTQLLKSTMTTSGIEISAKYVIITNEALAPYFNDFMNWKRRKGVDVELVTTKNIYDNYTGDLISGIVDNPGKIRQFLYDAYNDGNGIDYALLAGDNTIVPIRYGYYEDDATSNDDIIPTDLYFSEFEGDWNVDSDSRYGEPADNVDFYPEIYIGRIMVTTEAEVKNWTKKVKRYELNPGNGNPSYLTKAFFTQSDHMQVLDQARDIIARASWIQDTIVYEEQGGGCTPSVPNFPTGANVISEFNNHYGFCSFMAHGRPCAVGAATIYLNSEKLCDWTTKYTGFTVDSKYVVTAFDNGPSGCCGKAESGNGFDNMTNTDYPTIFYSVSCTTMPFDDYEYMNSPTERNLGESYTCISNGGGPIYLGNTRDGNIDASQSLFENFIEAITNNNLYNLGVAEAYSKEMYWGYDYVRFSHNLLGCPETELWTATPTTIGSNLVSEDGSNVTVSTNNVNNSKICVMSVLDNGASYYDTISNVTSHTFTNVSKPYYATITKHNKIPYTSYPTNVLIENKTLTSYAYLNCQTVSAGYSVDPNHTPDGNVVIANGASVTFDATGDILLAPGFEVQLGATFEAK
jgi:hypothetical protein